MVDVGVHDSREWLEADGAGGFASGTVSGIRTRRYHALLLAATRPPTGRMVLVNGIDAWIDRDSSQVALSSQRYAPDVIHPDGAVRLTNFLHDPWPTWRYTLDDGSTIVQELFVLRHPLATVMLWTAHGIPRPVRLVVRPLLSGRDYHALHHENPALRFDALVRDNAVFWSPYDGVPTIQAVSDGTYRHDPQWYRQFEYTEELARGLDGIEDLASPGAFSWWLIEGRPAAWVLTTEARGALPSTPHGISEAVHAWRAAEEARRFAFASPLDRAADAYVVTRGRGRSIVAGYPWFTDWGRDTFIAMRGLTLATGRIDIARDILLSWADTLSAGMLPNRFPDEGDTPEYNAVDASLWFVIAAFELVAAAAKRGEKLASADRRRLHEATDAIVEAYATGTRFGIHADDDGLLACGEAGIQLTWMDAKVGERVVTPRVGKPVEVNALWLNVLRIAGQRTDAWRTLFSRARASFRERFWNSEAHCLFDVVDVDHRPGVTDASIRPNQIFAVGGLPFQVLQGAAATSVVDAVETHLLTPLGLRTLAPGSPGYAAGYHGGVVERDSAYHQGTVWPWLMGAFAEAWLRVRGQASEARAEARRRFVKPLLEHLQSAGLGHVSEIADAEPPYVPRGCPFQAWSLGELLRLDRLVINGTSRTHRGVAEMGQVYEG